MQCWHDNFCFGQDFLLRQLVTFIHPACLICYYFVLNHKSLPSDYKRLIKTALKMFLKKFTPTYLPIKETRKYQNPKPKNLKKWKPRN